MNSQVPEKKSILVNIVGWILVALSALGLLTSFLQYIIVQVVYNGNVFESAPDQFKSIFSLGIFPFNSLESALLFYIAVSATMLVGALAMLTRRNWGRWLVIFLFCLQILFSLLRPFLMRPFLEDLTDVMHLPTGEFPFDPEEFIKRLSRLFEVFSLVFSLLFSGFIGWIVYKLTRPSIAVEFR